MVGETTRVQRRFPQGVASGDPGPDGVVLWTRVAPADTDRIEVGWEIATDPAMAAVVACGRALATASSDWTVKVRVRDPRLAADTLHWYRFTCPVGNVPSRVGRFRTLPDPQAQPTRLRLGLVSCQDFTSGEFNALGKLAEEDIDHVVHLGDYIYETVSDPGFQDRGPPRRRLSLPSGRARAQTLDDYRWLYRTYRADPNLQRLHERYAVLAIWDDHEFANDCYGVHHTDTEDEATNADPARRAAATRAWVEYTPADVPFDPEADPVEQVRIYRSFAFGDLVELVLTDERLYRDGPPCGLEPSARYATVGCDAIHKPGRTMLGVAQRRWFLDRMTKSTRRWKLWANETMVMPFKMPGWLAKRLHPEAGPVPMRRNVYLNLDQWDGYQWERHLLLSTLARAGVSNLLILTGDLHSFIAGAVRVEVDGEPRKVGDCLMVGSVTSANLVELLAHRTLPSIPIGLTWLLRAANPHLAYVNSSAHGYNLLELTPDRARCTMKVVSGVRWRWAFAYPLRRFVVGAG